MENQLKNEQSPYLKQHKDNPVNWLSWKKESLEKAKSEKSRIKMFCKKVELLEPYLKTD